jgi:predicted branched-subunit amino acid permease
MGAWGLVTGVAMVKAGLSVGVALFMSFTMYAGGAQLAVLPLIVTHTPMWVILLTAFCANLRFLIYSAQWRPFFMHLGFWRRISIGYLAADLTYVLAMNRYPDPPQTPEQREEATAYITRQVVLNWFVWQIPSVIGILAAQSIPTQWGLSFAGVLALLALTYAQVRDGRTLSAAAVAFGAALIAYGLPFRLNIVTAIIVAVAFGLWLDRKRG